MNSVLNMENELLKCLSNNPNTSCVFQNHRNTEISECYANLPVNLVLFWQKLRFSEKKGKWKKQYVLSYLIPMVSQVAAFH